MQEAADSPPMEQTVLATDDMLMSDLQQLPLQFSSGPDDNATTVVPTVMPVTQDVDMTAQPDSDGSNEQSTMQATSNQPLELTLPLQPTTRVSNPAVAEVFSASRSPQFVPTTLVTWRRQLQSCYTRLLSQKVWTRYHRLSQPK